MTKKKSDPLQALLEWVANESDLFTCATEDGDEDDRRRRDKSFAKIKTAWFDAGCPGTTSSPPKPSPPTIRVRIAVAVCQPVDGKVQWSASGGDLEDDALATRYARGNVHVESLVSFVEADVPLPQDPKTWTGEVVS